jgi:hypothetical protein
MDTPIQKKEIMERVNIKSIGRRKFIQNDIIHGIMKYMSNPVPNHLFLVLLVGFICSSHAFADDKKFELKNGTQWYPFIEWNITNPSAEGNPYDVVAEVIFTHLKTDEKIITRMFYDNDGTWKFRFTSKITGVWTFQTISSDKVLNGWAGRVNIKKNPDKKAHGFMKSFGSKWGWEGTEEVFVPQYVMGKYLRAYLGTDGPINTAMIEEDIEEFIHGHGFTGFHFAVDGEWFKVEDPDPLVYAVLETLISRVHQLGGACHIWLWYSDIKPLQGQPLNAKDQRNLRYLAARLGPLPGWSIGYGVDVENGWASREQLDEWKSFLEQQMGWKHFLGARVGFDEHGLSNVVPRPPRPPLDEKFNAPVGDEYTHWLGGDYIGYTSYRPLYDRYIEVINHRPEKPSFEEDRFRLRNIERWKHKDYDEELTRRGLWHSAMAGGVANIWGNFLPHDEEIDYNTLNTLGSKPYRNKDQIKTYSMFFKNRFLKDFKSKKAGETMILFTTEYDKVILYSEDTVEIDLQSVNTKSRMVAVDAKRPYKEIKVSIRKGEDIWKAPYISDWAVAVGNF